MVAESSSIVIGIVDSVMIGSSFTFIAAIASSSTTSRCSNKQRG